MPPIFAPVARHIQTFPAGPPVPGRPSSNTWWWLASATSIVAILLSTSRVRLPRASSPTRRKPATERASGDHLQQHGPPIGLHDQLTAERVIVPRVAPILLPDADAEAGRRTLPVGRLGFVLATTVQG